MINKPFQKLACNLVFFPKWFLSESVKDVKIMGIGRGSPFWEIDMKSGRCLRLGRL